jgi:H+-transporting ATPase
MIWMAIIIEAAIESWPDMGILLAIQFLNASLSYYETTKAGDAVAALKASLKPVAYVKRDGKFLSMDAALLVPGDLVLLGSGGAVPADCVIMDSQIDVDQVRRQSIKSSLPPFSPFHYCLSHNSPSPPLPLYPPPRLP